MSEMLMTIGQSTHMGVAEIAEVLGTLPFLASVSKRRRMKLIEEGFLRSYEGGDKVLREGDHGHSMFVLLSGSVAVQATAADGTIKQLAAFAKPGTWFGEGAILGRTRRSATIVAQFRSVLLELEKITLEKLDNAEEGVLDKLKQSFERRSIETFLGQHSGFAQLSDSERALLVQDASLESTPRGASVFKEGERSATVVVLKTGSCQLVRKTVAGTSVLAYFSAGDVVGLFDDQKRPGSLNALEFVEYVLVAKDVFEQVRKSADERVSFQTASGLTVPWSKQFEKAVDAANQIVVEGSFLPHLFDDSAHQARSLLTIDLDLCIRCGNCTRACEARHGHARMTRRGKKLIRGPEHHNQPVLLPSSCRHCETPECMIGCPTGAIHRKPTGEVAIHDFCIGCSNCAIRCPWDNITMVETPGRTVKGLDTPKIASKCDLCFGYDEANCVNNCPTRAILRIDPVSYFPEVAEALRKKGGTTFERTTKAEAPDRSRLAIWLGAAIAIGLLVLVRSLATPYYAFTKSGFILGAAAFASMVLATCLAARRQMNRWPRKAPHAGEKTGPIAPGRAQLGPFYVWARAHVAFGVVALVAVVLHSNLVLGGFITSMLMFLLAAEIATGLFGVAFYKWWPKQVTRLERGSQVEEDIGKENNDLLEMNDELAKGVPDPDFVRRALRAGPSSFACLSPRYDAAAAEARALERLGELPRDPVASAPIETLAKNAVRLSEIGVIRSLYAVRRGWLAIHIGVTAMLLTLAAVHVGSVLTFYVRF
jgi:Fe-S-cluster-containing dehydrogenase component/CRP-like cAMP-binding protein